MRIALLTDGIFPYVVGGMQKHSYYLCKFLAQRGVEVDLYHTDGWMRKSNYDITKLEFFTEEEKKNINSIVIPFPDSIYFVGHYLWRSYKYSELIFEELKKRPKVDFIYSKGLTPWKLLKERNQNFPPISNKSHGYEFFQIAPSFKNYLTQFLLRTPFRFITLSSDYIFSYGGKITEIIESMGVPNERIIEIPTGIESDWVREKEIPMSSIKKFIFIGRYERRKGIEELTEILKKFNFEDGGEFHFIGDIPSSHQVKNQNVIYHGQITDTTKIKKLLQSSDYLICPSFSEGMPNVIMEGMASGCAIIATNVGAVSQQVSSNNGWLIQANNKEELLDAIQKAIRINQDELIRMKKASIKKVKNLFLWNKIADQTIEALNKLINVEK